MMRNNDMCTNNTNNNDAMDKQCVDFFKTGYIIAKTEDLVGCHCGSEDVVNTYLDVKARDIDIEDIRDAFAKVEADIDELGDDTDEDCDDCDCCSSGDCDCDSEDDCEDIRDLDDIEKDNYFKTGYCVGRMEEKFPVPMSSEEIKQKFELIDYFNRDFDFLRKAFTKVDNTEGIVSSFDDEPLEIEKVIFSGKATIVFWNNGEKSVVKCQKGDAYSQEEGLAMAICKMMYGNDNTFNDVINAAMKKAIVVKDEPKKVKTATAKITSGKIERKN